MNPHNENPNPTQRETGFEPHVEVDGAVDVSPHVASGELSPASAPGAWNFSSGAGGFPPPTRFIPEDLRVPWGWWDVRDSEPGAARYRVRLPPIGRG